jgi:hypothetical protein
MRPSGSKSRSRIGASSVFMLLFYHVLPKGLADKLFKVWLRDGSETWLLIHIEVQGEPETTFPRRMFLYNSRAFDRYNREVVSLALLTDAQPGWRPDHFEYGRWGANTRLNFLAVKLLDYQGQEEALQRDPNPIAQIVLAHLQALATRKDPAGRARYKVQLVKGLYDRGWSAEDVRQLFRLIDWLMDLPTELQQDFRKNVFRWEEERRMPYVTSIERLAKAEGRVEELRLAIGTGLQSKFGAAGKRLLPKIRKMDDLKQLRTLHQIILEANVLDDVRKGLPR